MKSLAKEIIDHLESLRKKYNFTQEKMCEDICSHRQYERYVSGETCIPQSKLLQFCKKLNISPDDFYYSCRNKEKIEYNSIMSLYNQVVLNNYDKVLIESIKVNREYISNPLLRKCYDYCICKAKYKKKKAHPGETIDKASSIIGYPECLRRKAYDFVDVVTLELIAEIEVKKEKLVALTHLSEILTSKENTFISYEASQLLPSVYASVSILYNRLHKYKESYNISKKGIEYSKLYNDMGSLTHLLYINAHSMLMLGKIHEATIQAIRCLGLVIAKENDYELKAFYKTLKKDFNIDPLDAIQKYKKELLHIEKNAQTH